MRPLSEFLDYREFLREYCAYRRETSPRFTCRDFAELAGVDAELMMRIVDGREHLQERDLPRFLALLDLQGGRAEYFELLVRYGRWADGTPGERSATVGDPDRERKEIDGRHGSLVR